MSYYVVIDYKHDNRLRAGLNALAKETFGLDFEPWYRAGFWDERYVPYSIVEEDGTVAANVSVNRVTVLADGKSRNAVMLGTVMCAVPYRGRGYAARLMHTVLDDCKHSADFVYLFANETVLDFYPKFGFAEQEERQCILTVQGASLCNERVVRLDIARQNDLDILRRFIETGIAAPKRITVPTNRALILYYCQSGYKDSVFYYPDSDLLVFLHEGTLLDYYSLAPIPIRDVAARLVPGGQELALGFTPMETQGLTYRYCRYDDHLFITDTGLFTGDFMFPSLSRA
ncbi:MAG: GNAT family N-acetyltransferase [Acetanaerobacterium sp.]